MSKQAGLRTHLKKAKSMILNEEKAKEAVRFFHKAGVAGLENMFKEDSQIIGVLGRYCISRVDITTTLFGAGWPQERFLTAERNLGCDDEALAELETEWNRLEQDREANNVYTDVSRGRIFQCQRNADTSRIESIILWEKDVTGTLVALCTLKTQALQAMDKAFAKLDTLLKQGKIFPRSDGKGNTIYSEGDGKETVHQFVQLALGDQVGFFVSEGWKDTLASTKCYIENQTVQELIQILATTEPNDKNN
jgi:hypothetical protein